jgi:uncharacterized membrane protein
MKDPRRLARGAVSGAVAFSLMLAGGRALADKPGFEKCAGIVKAGKNDCGSSKHSCSGKAAIDADPEEWIYVPEGTCDKIVGGKLVAAEPKEDEAETQTQGETR